VKCIFLYKNNYYGMETKFCSQHLFGSGSQTKKYCMPTNGKYFCLCLELTNKQELHIPGQGKNDHMFSPLEATASLHPFPQYQELPISIHTYRFVMDLGILHVIWFGEHGGACNSRHPC
jgi:hypothetical protein